MGKTQQKIRKGVRRCLRPNGTGRRITTLFMSLVLVLALVAPMLPAMEVQAYEGNPYADLVGTTTAVEFNGMDWYIIADNSTAVDAGSVTLLAKECISASKFGDTNNSYSASTVKSYLDGLTTGSGSFATVADAIKSVDLTDVGVTGAKLYLLSVSEAKLLSRENRQIGSWWWLRSRSNLAVNFTAFVDQSGKIKPDGTEVNNELGIRPAMWIKLYD